MGYNGIKKLYLRLKKLCWFKTYQFFLATTPTKGWVYHVEKNLAPSCLRSWLTDVMKKYPHLQYCMEVHADKARKFSIK